MSSVISPGISGKSFKPTPPAKGSFPLDRTGQCRELVEKYMKCMKQNKGNIENCRELSKEYLECRMNSNLMAKDEWKNLGFRESNTENHEGPKNP